MTALNEEEANNSPRVAIFSLRNVDSHVPRACGYEFEDVIKSELDSARILAPKHKGLSSQVLKAKGWLSRYVNVADGLGLGTENEALDQDYDLFFFSIARPRDLNYLSELKDWRKRSRFAVCWLQELWIEDIPRLGKVLNQLNKFDHVICPFYHTTEPLRERLTVPVTYLPWGVDTELFCPFPNPPQRAIDVCNIGDVSPVSHDALVDYADKSGKFYLYNTIHGRHSMASHKDHRHNYSGTLKRSKFFLSYLAKVARTSERGSQQEFGLRYIEGIAAGTILLGNRVPNLAFEEFFGWPGSVIEVPYGSPNISDVIDQLEAKPRQTEAIRKSNVIQSLKRHDHLHRWEKVLEIAGIEQLPKMTKRRTKLAKLIDMVEKSAGKASREPEQPANPTGQIGGKL